MTEWFRSWHGAPTDPKWLSVARRAKAPVAVVVATVWALLDDASQNTDRGSIQHFDAEVIAAFLGVEESEVRAVVKALVEKGILSDGGRIANWDKRQPKREREEDFSTDRVRAFRERHETPSPTSETPRNANETPAAHMKRSPPSTPPTDSESESDLSENFVSDVCVKKNSRAGGRRYPADFEEFWRRYPTDALMSKKAAACVWARMTGVERQAALGSLGAFRSYCAQHPTYRPVHAVRYLSEDRSAGFAALAEKTQAQVFVAAGTPEWAAWQSFRGKPINTKIASAEHGGVEGWHFPSRWPPKRSTADEETPDELEARRRQRDQKTGPPAEPHERDRAARKGA
jgi:hypothetical protein